MAAIDFIQDVTGGPCGWSNFGHQLGFKNANTERVIDVFYVVTTKHGLENQSTNGSKIIGPGQTEWITCSTAVPFPGDAISLKKTGATFVEQVEPGWRASSQDE